MLDTSVADEVPSPVGFRSTGDFMAVVRAGSAPLTVLLNGSFYDTPSEVIEASETLIHVVSPSGVTQQYVGSFVYDDQSDELVGGTLTGIAEFSGGQLLHEIQGMVFPIPTYLSFADRNDFRGAITFALRGNDDITGSRWNDRLAGFGGSDTIKAGAGNDEVLGNDGADRLSGGAGNDRLSGGDGADRIAGGYGKDALLGGNGADVFVFASVTDSLRGRADLIGDFAREDTIDLRAIDANATIAGNQAFVLVTRLTGVGQVALQATQDAVRLIGSIDADAAPEFIILIRGAVPVAADLLL